MLQKVTVEGEDAERGALGAGSGAESAGSGAEPLRTDFRFWWSSAFAGRGLREVGSQLGTVSWGVAGGASRGSVKGVASRGGANHRRAGMGSFYPRAIK